VQTIASATTMLRNSSPSVSEMPRRINSARHRPLAGFQIGDLRAKLAVLVGEIAGREIVE
jgi:hypothetical protein